MTIRARSHTGGLEPAPVIDYPEMTIAGINHIAGG
ncbi:hypothetical protein FHS81_001217 [Pseudochelatococcus contaminans]|uniref:Uncharacterized protein n=1 Tax=Pseudochelatococcus contaminans TaxID=1538103 RepID=A0A7W5Z3N1_9HYPH|nr:hypothetical protein [Pseudochelatococcus contaminans]